MNWANILFSSLILKVKIDIDLVFSLFRKKWQFIIYFSLAKKPVNICMIDTGTGLIGTDEMSNMLRVRKTMHVWEQLEVFNVIRRFFNWDSSSTHFSNNKFRLKPVHSFQTFRAGTKPWEQSFFSKSNLLFGLCKPVQGNTFNSRMLCSGWPVLDSGLVISGLHSPKTSQIWKWPWYELGFTSGGCFRACI